MIDENICDDDIHNEFMNFDEDICPLCNKILLECTESPNMCCDDSNVLEINGISVCIKCGMVHNSICKYDYIDFYENIFRIKRKSVYNRKYHIIKIINNLLCDYNVVLSYHEQVKILKIFEKIGYILPKVNCDRKRMISTNFLFKKIFEMMNKTYPLSVTKSKKTQNYYNSYWDHIMSIIGDKIIAVINE